MSATDNTVTATENDLASARVLERAQIAEQIKTTSEIMSRLNAQRVALCDRLSNDERETLLRFEESIAVNEDMSKKSAELRRNRSMSDEDKTQLEAARNAHKKLINSDANKLSASFHVGKAYLSQFKLTHRKDGRINVSVRGQI